MLDIAQLVDSVVGVVLLVKHFGEDFLGLVELVEVDACVGSATSQEVDEIPDVFGHFFLVTEVAFHLFHHAVSVAEQPQVLAIGHSIHQFHGVSDIAVIAHQVQIIEGLFMQSELIIAEPQLGSGLHEHILACVTHLEEILAIGVEDILEMDDGLIEAAFVEPLLAPIQVIGDIGAVHLAEHLLILVQAVMLTVAGLELGIGPHVFKFLLALLVIAAVQRDKHAHAAWLAVPIAQ